jgi:hypothetical protein
MSVPTDQARREWRRSNRAVDSPLLAGFWVLFMAWQVWFQADNLRQEGFTWLRVVCIALAGCIAGLWLSRLPFVRRFLDGSRDTPKA